MASYNTLVRNSTTDASEATRIRVLAGSPHSRRGSVLVLVVGVLALLAIIIVVYTSVGQADVRGGRTLVNKARLDDQSKAIGDHISRIIGEDASAVRVQRVYADLNNANRSYYSVRETSDYPYTDPYSRSNLTLGVPDPDFARFDPVGNLTRAWQGGGEDPRVPSDPYLATIEPSWVNNNIDTLPGLPSPFELMGKQRDWGHLSLISPSGLPVNLANLRGNFRAAPGFNTGDPYNAGGVASMCDHMYLLARNGNYADSPSFVQAGSVDEYNSPAIWSNNRLESFRPVTWNPTNLAAGDVKYMGNTFADADGDGWYDALWQELVDASDPSRPVNLLQGGTGVRWFVAPRIIDLSGMINVNTATSFALPPDIENPAGITPSDVDLERFLTTVDARQYFGVYPGSDYYDPNEDFASATPRDYFAAGRTAFQGILEGRLTGLAEVTGVNGFPGVYGPVLANGNVPQWAAQLGVEPATGAGPSGTYLLGSVTRAQLYAYGGKDELGGRLRADVGATTNYYLKQPGGFGLGDELDLRARGATNDDRTLSRLEAVTGVNSNLGLAALNPLRPTRDAVTDREAGIMPVGHDITRFGETLPQGMAQYFTDPRHLLTTLSGARPIGYSAVQMTSANVSGARALDEKEVRSDINRLLQRAISLNTADMPLPAANEIFSTYAHALSPFLGQASIWDEADANKRSTTLSYGGVSYDQSITDPTNTAYGDTIAPFFKGRTAEIAVRSAAHMTLNLMAWQDAWRTNSSQPLAQPDNRPLAATLLLDDNKRTNVASTDVYTGGIRKFPYWQAAGSTRLSPTDTTGPQPVGNSTTDIKAYTFDLNMGVPTGGANRAGNLAGSGGNNYTTGYALNLFAAQPQPFITAAVSFDMYADTPFARGGDGQGTGPGDGEWYVTNPVNVANGATPILATNGMSIKGDVDVTNNDFLMECIVFQITNPFDAPITLGSPTTNFSYYLEFAGKYYDVADYDDAGNRTVITLQARQSRCVYVLSGRTTDINTRLQNVDPAVAGLASGEGSPIQRWLKHQLSMTVYNGGNPVRTVRIDPVNNGRPVTSVGMTTDMLDPSATSDANKVVKLWRVVRQNAGEPSSNNNLENDYLVDRLHDPSFGQASTRASLYRRLNSGQNYFTGIGAGPTPGDAMYPFYHQYNANDNNQAFSITLHGAIRRRTDPKGGPLPGGANAPETFAGVMPSWCLEPKIGGTFTASVNAKNVIDNNPGIATTDSPTGIPLSAFTGDPAGAPTLFGLIRSGIGASFTTASHHPASRTSTDDATNTIGNDLSNVGWVQGNKATQLPIYPRRSGNLTQNEVERPPLRPADLLMPWAIGPWQDPTVTDPELRYTTLSEAMAFALNYASSTNAKSYEIQISKALDHCRLSLSRYVAFNDNPGSTPDGQWRYQPGNPVPPDPLLLNGTPLALNILDRFRTTRYGSIDSAMAGKININTAPLSVVRMLPFVTPASVNSYTGDGLGFDKSWMASTTGAYTLKIRDEAGAVTSKSLWKSTDDRWDVAATLVAYRDKNAVVARGEQGSEDGNTRVYVDFSAGMPGVNANDGTQPNNTAYRGGRRFMTNCVNLREELGYQSPGEIVMAVVQDNTRRTGLTLDNDHLKQLGIDRLNSTKLNGNNQDSPSNFQVPVQKIADVAALGRTGTQESQREQAIGLTAQASVRNATTGTGTHFVQGGTSADYDRKLGIANALLNTVSTNSDYYCAYFVVNGYTEADTQGLEAWTGAGNPPAGDERYTRPMTPSIQRRYMMVLDRSQCLRAGDKPKILMFEELPVK